MTFEAIYSAGIFSCQKRRDHRQYFFTVPLIDSVDMLAIQRLGIQIIYRLLFRPARAKLIRNGFAAYNASLNNALPCQHFFSDDSAFTHRPGEHHRIQTIKIHRGQILCLLLDLLHDLSLFTLDAIACQHDYYQRKYQRY